MHSAGSCAGCRVWLCSDTEILSTSANGNVVGAYPIEKFGETYVKVDAVHDMEKFEAKEPGCEDGNSEYYNGKVKMPIIRTVGGMALADGTDYTLRIENSKGELVTSPKAAGNANYKASKWKTVTLRIKVR